MKNIILSIIVIGVLLTTSMVTVNAVNCEPPICIYVDDDNIQGPWDGTFEHPYQTIVDGIAAASNGNTVFVFNGIYSDYLYVTKSIKLIGENQESTIIDTTLEFEYADYVTVRGFTVKLGGIRLWHSSHHTVRENILSDRGGIQLNDCSNSVVSENVISPTLDNGITIKSDSISNILSNNYISGANDHGILIRGDSNNTIVTNNIITNCGWDGINVDKADNTVITDNTITNNDHSILLDFVSNSVLNGNTITDNDKGIDIDHSENLIVSHNIISDNNRHGIDVSHSENIEISNNTITNNHEAGIDLSNDDNIIVTDNSIVNNYVSGICAVASNNNQFTYNIIKNNADGIWLYESHENIVEKNEITDNNHRGILIEGRIFDNTIFKNNIKNNRHGLELLGFIDPNADPGFKSRIPFGNDIIANNIEENVEYGIYSNYLTLDNHVYYNNFINNYQNARDTGTNTWYKTKLTGSEGNYWCDFENNQGYPNYYYIPPLPLRNNDLFPSLDPFEIENIEEFDELSDEEAEQIAHGEKTISTILK